MIKKNANFQNDNEILPEHLRDDKKNDLVDFLFNVGDVIKFHRQRQKMRIEDLSKKIYEKYNIEIHPSIISRYENKRIPIKNHHIAYIFDVLGIYLESVFSDKIVIVELKELTTSLKFQYLVKQLRNFFTDAEILNIILAELENKLHYSWKAAESYFKKYQEKLKVSENNK
ncbi:MAG: helix-turn-helix domain-containing protein [Leptonema sp. (in: bacteria)]